MKLYIFQEICPDDLTIYPPEVFVDESKAQERMAELVVDCDPDYRVIRQYDEIPMYYDKFSDHCDANDIQIGFHFWTTEI